jgi:hypothetical protein
MSLLDNPKYVIPFTISSRTTQEPDPFQNSYTRDYDSIVKLC